MPVSKRWLAGVGALACVGLMGFVSYPQYQWHQALETYERGADFKARKSLEELLAGQRLDDVSTGAAHLLLAEIALKEDRLAEARQAGIRALKILQQAKYDGAEVSPWLDRARHVNALLVLIPVAVVHKEGFERFSMHLYEALAFVTDVNAQVYPQWADLRRLAAEHDRTDETDTRWLARWQGVVAAEPLYQRLRLAAIEPPAPLQKPDSQDEARALIKRWQRVKSRAFMQRDVSALNTVLTDGALQEAVAAVSWWQNHPGTYDRLELDQLRFLRVSYRDAHRAEVIAKISETRQNSREGKQKETYVVDYQLRRVGSSWFISNMHVRRS